MQFSIESLLSARVFLNPQLVDDRIYFISNVSGHLSLYRMDYGGSVPEPLLPNDIALQNPELMGGEPFAVLANHGFIIVMMDHDGDEHYQPMQIPLAGGFPEPLFPEFFSESQVHLYGVDKEQHSGYFVAESLEEEVTRTYRVSFETMMIEEIGQSRYGGIPCGYADNHEKIVLMDVYNSGDHVLFLKENGEPAKVLYGVPLDQRVDTEHYRVTGFNKCHFTKGNGAIIFITCLFRDDYGLGFLDLSDPSQVLEIAIHGLRHVGQGELTDLVHLFEDQYIISFSIDGCSWSYVASFDSEERAMYCQTVLVGEGLLSNGVIKSKYYDPASERVILSFTSATSPTQLYSIEYLRRPHLVKHTRERVFGIDPAYLSEGEDASYVSHDGLRVSARLYFPSGELGFIGPRPVINYVHGGPQSQEKPDFAWFSMPLIQFLTLNGFAVFVPNVRGSSGYGFEYMNKVVRDWGGNDRLDHVYAMTDVLTQDERIDTTRAAVIGRSYGGYMTLILAAQHPTLWKAAVDMFGPYNLADFLERVPTTWRPYMILMMGDPEKDREMLIERSPRTYLDNLMCPLMVMQGKNDPRVKAEESAELVDELKLKGKNVEFILFENEGHDVLKYENRVRCYTGITEFFVKHLHP